MVVHRGTRGGTREHIRRVYLMGGHNNLQVRQSQRRRYSRLQELDVCFGKALTEIYTYMVEWKYYIANEYTPWAAYHTIMSGSLAALNK